MARHISDERKTAYYVGLGLQVLGGLLFASTFVTFFIHFGDFSNFEARAKSEGFRAFGGIVLLIIGGIIRGIAAKGLAGSGVLRPRMSSGGSALASSIRQPKLSPFQQRKAPAESAIPTSSAAG